jgi:hypothetical protein
MKRQLQGIGLLAFAFFYAFAPSCGVVGELLFRGSAWLIGQTGSTLLALTTFAVGVLLVVHPKAWVRLARWAFVAPKRPVVHAQTSGAKVIPIRTPVVEKEPANVRDARGGLKFMGFTGGEIDSAFERVSLVGAPEEIIRASLKLLKKAV